MVTPKKKDKNLTYFILAFFHNFFPSYFLLLLVFFFFCLPKRLAIGQSEIEMLTFEEEFISGAIKAKQKPEESPSSFFILSGDDFRKLNFVSLGDALSYTPGMWGIYNWSIYNFGLRGIHGGPKAGSRILKFMLDSEDYIVFRPSGEVLIGPEFIPPSFIKSVEVVKGPASALYGANAFMGVVNITTKEPDEMPPLSVKVSPVGLFKNRNFQGLFDIATGHVFQIGEAEIPFGIGIYLFNQKRDGMKLSDDSIGFSPDIIEGIKEREELANRLKDRENKNDTLSTLSIFSKTGIRYSAFNLEIKGIFQALSASSQFSENENSLLVPQNRNSIYNLGGSAKLWQDIKISGELMQGWTITPSLYLGFFLSNPFKEKFIFFEPDRKAILYAEGTEVYVRDFGSSSIDIRFETSAKKGKNLLLVGADLMNDTQKIEKTFKITEGKISPEPEAQPPEPVKTFRNIGIYGQVFAFPIEKLSQVGELSILGLGGLLGARYDDHNIYEDVFNTRVGLVILPVKKPGVSTYIKGIFGSSFRPPSPEQLFAIGVRPGDLQGDKEIKPEKARITEGIIGGAFEIPIGTQSVEIKPEVSIYNIQVRDAIKFDKKGNFIRATNKPLQTSQGADIYMGIKFWKIRTNFSYSLVQVETTEEFLGEMKEIKDKFFPESMFFSSAIFSYEFGNYYELDLGIFSRYISKRNISILTAKWLGLTYIPDRPLPPYFTSGLSLSFGTKRIGYITKIYIRAENILGKQYWEPGFTGFDTPGNPTWFFIGLESIL